MRGLGDDECNDGDEARNDEREQETLKLKSYINVDDVEGGSKHSAGYCERDKDYERDDEESLKDKKSKLDIAPKVGSN